MSDSDLTPAERAEIERAESVLADEAVWMEPPAHLQEAVVAAITSAAGLEQRRHRVRLALAGAAAVILLAVGVTVGVQLTRADPVEYAATLSGTELAPSATGEVTLTKTSSGWDIRLHATGLPRREGGEFYQAWLKDDDGLLVPIGSFNDGRDVTLWSGVGPADFPTLTVTQETADGDQASSGQVVLVGVTDQHSR
jgi:Anti-sigma-K factor rskA